MVKNSIRPKLNALRILALSELTRILGPFSYLWVQKLDRTEIEGLRSDVVVRTDANLVPVFATD